MKKFKHIFIENINYSTQISFRSKVSCKKSILQRLFYKNAIISFSVKIPNLNEYATAFSNGTIVKSRCQQLKIDVLLENVKEVSNKRVSLKLIHNNNCIAQFSPTNIKKYSEEDEYVSQIGRESSSYNTRDYISSYTVHYNLLSFEIPFESIPNELFQNEINSLTFEVYYLNEVRIAQLTDVDMDMFKLALNTLKNENLDEIKAQQIDDAYVIKIPNRFLMFFVVVFIILAFLSIIYTIIKNYYL